MRSDTSTTRWLRTVLDDTGRAWPVPAGGSDDDPGDEAATTDDAAALDDDPEADDGDADDDSDVPAGSKRAVLRDLAAERERRRAAEAQAARAAELETELEELRAASMTEQEKALEEARRAGAEEARAELEAERTAALERAVRAELRATAAGKLADPDDALAFVDLQHLAASSDEDRPAAMVEAIDALVERKPHLAARPDADAVTASLSGRVAQGHRTPPSARSVDDLTPEDFAERFYG